MKKLLTLITTLAALLAVQGQAQNLTTYTSDGYFQGEILKTTPLFLAGNSTNLYGAAGGTNWSDVKLPPRRFFTTNGPSLEITFAGTNASSTAAFTLVFAASNGSTNYPSGAGAQFTLAPVQNGTNNVTVRTNLPPLLYQDVIRLRLLSVTSAVDATNGFRLKSINVGTDNVR